MHPMTDMLGQDVNLGDRIAAAFRYRPFNGTTAELRSGVVEGIIFRCSSQRNGSTGEKEAHLRVRWDSSSQDVQTKQGVEKLLAGRENRTGQQQDRPAMLDQDYRERTSDIVVSLRRFIKVS